MNLRVAALVVSICAFSGTRLFAAAAGDSPHSVSPETGHDLFISYCAACHGPDGKGEGPAAVALRIRPANLTTLSIRNSGKFPELRVYQTIQGGVNLPAHGSTDMPVWGKIFREMSGPNSDQPNVRIRNLVVYLKTIQMK